MKKQFRKALSLFLCLLSLPVSAADESGQQWHEISRDWIEVPFLNGNFELGNETLSTSGSLTTLRIKGFGYNSANPLFQDYMQAFSSGTTATGVDNTKYPQKYQVITEMIPDGDGNTKENRALLLSKPYGLREGGQSMNAFLPKVYFDTGTDSIVTPGRKYKLSLDYKLDGVYKDPDTQAALGTGNMTIGYRSYGGTAKSAALASVSSTTGGAPITDDTPYTTLEYEIPATEFTEGNTYFAIYTAGATTASINEARLDNFKVWVEGTHKISDVYFTTPDPEKKEGEENKQKRIASLSEAEEGTIYVNLDVYDEIKDTENPLLLMGGLYKKGTQYSDGTAAKSLVSVGARGNQNIVRKFWEGYEERIQKGETKVTPLQYTLTVPIDLSQLPENADLSEYEIAGFVWNGLSGQREYLSSVTLN